MIPVSRVTYTVLRGFQTGMIMTVTLNLAMGNPARASLGFSAVALIIGLVGAFLRVEAPK